MDREQLLKEIFELEPDLLTKESEVRALVASMLEHKPRLIPDVAMKSLVRARLLAQFETNKTEVEAGFDWSWLWYTAPVGVTAMLMLLTSPASNPGPVLDAPSSPSRGIEMLTSPQEATAPVSKSATKTGPRSDSSLESSEETVVDGGEVTADMATFSSRAGVVSENYLLVEAQKGGSVVYISSLTTNSPAIVVIRDLLTKEVVGQSLFVSPVQGGSVSVEITNPLKADTQYEAALYLDDGDGTWSVETDVLVFSASFAVGL